MHNWAKEDSLQTAKMFRKYLVQPMRNLPSIETLNQRDLSGTSDIFYEIQNGCRNALQNASAKKMIKIAKLHLDKNIIEVIVQKSADEGTYDEQLSKKENAIKILEGNEDLKSELIALILENIFPGTVDFEDALEGVCGVVSPYFASQYLQGRSWKDMTAHFSQGIDRNLRDAFSVYIALKKGPVYSLLSAYFKVLLNEIARIPLYKEKKENPLEILLELEDGVYDIQLCWENNNHSHVILFHKEGDEINIIDPNIGFLNAKGEKAGKLLKLINKTYGNQDPLWALIVSEFKNIPEEDLYKEALSHRF